MQSILKLVVNSLKSSARVLATLAIIATSLMMFSSRAHALTISVSTQTAVTLPAAPDVWVARVIADQTFTVIYATSNSSSYSIMLASQTRNSTVGGAAAGWALSTLFSTTVANANTVNIAKVLNGAVLSNGTVVVYYYDSSLNNLRVLSGAASAAPLAPVSVASGTVGAIEMTSGGSDVTVVFSSQAANGRYELVLSSVAIANVGNPITASVQVTSTTDESVPSIFKIVNAVDSGLTKVYYFDKINSALREVILDQTTNSPTVGSRSTIDSGDTVNALQVADGGSGESSITRVAYTLGTTLKFAVQRRRISGQCWYIQKVDDTGSAQGVGTGGGARISYTKSSNLWEARASNGVFFDDFSESIVNTQQGLVKLLSNVTKGSILQSPSGATRDRGVFQPSDTNAIGTISWLSLTGTIANTFGTGLPSIDVAAVVTGSATAVGSADLNPADSSNLGMEGGRTDLNGAYQIDVASGAALAVSASSSPWVFLNKSSVNVVTVSTITTSGDSAIGSAGDFIGVSSPTITVFDISNTGASQAISTFSIIYMEQQADNLTFAARTPSAPLSAGFTASMNFRLVPQSAQGTAPTISVSTNPEANAIFFDNTQVPASRVLATVSTNTLWSRFASTDTTNLPKWFTLVATTRTAAGHIMQGRLVDAVNLRPLEINFATVTVAMRSLPGLAVTISTGEINTSRQTTIMITSTFTNNFSTEMSTNVYLTTSTVIGTDPSWLKNDGDIPLTSVAVTQGQGSAIGSTVTLVGSPLGASIGTSYFVRISSRPGAGGSIANGDKGAIHYAFSPSIQFSSPAITGVTLSSTGFSAVISTGAALAGNGGGAVLTTLDVLGRGFVSVSSVTFSSSTVLAADNFAPRFIAGKAQVLQVVTSTMMRVQIDNVNANAAQFINASFHLFISTSHARETGVASTAYSGIGITGTTITATSTEFNANGVITIGTPAVQGIFPSTVSNVGVWPITLVGRGLGRASTVQIFALDGSTSGVPTIVGATNLSAGVLVSTTVSIDFRSPAFGGKLFYVTLVSTSGTYEGMADDTIPGDIKRISSAGGGVFISVSSPTVSVQAPILTNPGVIARNAVYNSTGQITIGLSGLGVVNGSSVTLNDTSVQGFAPGNVTVVAPAASTGAFAAFTTTGITNAAAGNYTVTVTSVIPQLNGISFTASASTTMQIIAGTLNTATLVSHNNAYTTLQFATYTVTGTGLLPNVTFYLSVAGQDRIGSTSRSTNSADYSSLNVAFDLRAATTTSASWSLVGFSTGPILGSTWTATASSALTISSIPTLGIIPNATRTNTLTNNALAIPITGEGLVNGATVQMQYFGTDLATLGTTDFASGLLANTLTRVGTIVSINGAGVNSQSTGTLAVDLSSALPSASWRLQMVAQVANGTYGSAVLQVGNSMLARAASNIGTFHQTNTSTFTVTESSAPSAPTGLTVLAAGTKSVTLRWVSPGDDGNANALQTGSQFIVYYSSGESNRGQGCAPCYPLAASNGTTGKLEQQGTTNFAFSNTWAQYLVAGYRDSGRSTTTAKTNAFDFSTASVRGLTVSTITLNLSDVTVKTSSTATGVAGNAVAGGIVPGRLVEATLSIDPGVTAGDFWFIVRAIDEVGNISPPEVVYTTAAARIGAGAQTVTDVIDPNATTVLSNTDLGGGVTQGGIIPPGALDGSDTLNRVADSNPPANTAGVSLVGPAVDITLGSGKTDFLKPITLTFSLSGAALNTVAGANPYLVRVAFFNGARWVVIRESSFSNNTVSATVTHLTKFAVVVAAPVTNLSQAVVYPNPYRPTLATHLAQKITFDQVPANTDIKIYTLGGELVRQLKDDDGDGIVAWDAKNENGNDVASGVYFALLKGGGDTKTLKVAVQR